MCKYSDKFSIQFIDVGENNELTNKGILRLLQEIAGKHSDSVGVGLNDTPKTGIAWIILNWKLKVFMRPKWNEKVFINTWTKCEKSLFCYRNFKIYDDRNNLIAVATSKWILFDVNKKSICRVSKEIQEKFLESNESVFEENIDEKIKEPEDSSFAYEYKIQRRDIDTNHHVNNLNYLDYAIEALPEDIYLNTNFSNIEIMYKHEAKLGDTISIFYYQSNKNEYIITIKDSEDKKIHAIVKLYN